MARLYAPALLRPIVRPIVSKFSCKRYIHRRSEPFRNEEHLDQSRRSTSACALAAVVLGACGGVSLASAESPFEAVEHPQEKVGGTQRELETSTTRIESSLTHVHTHTCKYLVCGAGLASSSAVRTLVQEDPDATLLVVAPECRDGFCRSREDNELWNSANRRFLGTEFITEINVQSREASTSSGKSISFEECLIATGTQMEEVPEQLVHAKDARSLVVNATTESGWKQIENTIDGSSMSRLEDPHVTIVGAGWFALKIANDLLQVGADITFLFSEPRILARYLPTYLCDEVISRFRWRNPNIDFVPYSAVRYITKRKSRSGVSEAEVTTCQVFDAFAIEQFRTDLVAWAPTEMKMKPINDISASLQMDNGTLVANAELSVASNVYGAGSCINYPTEAGRRSSWGAMHAMWSGRHAALNMLHKRASYRLQPSIRVDLSSIGLKFHMVGKVSSSLESFGYFLRMSSGDRKTSLFGGALGDGVVFFIEVVPAHSGQKRKYRLCGAVVLDGNSQPSSTASKLNLDFVGDMLRSHPLDRGTLERRMKDVAARILHHSEDDAPLLSRNTQPRKVRISDEMLWIGLEGFTKEGRFQKAHDRYNDIFREYSGVPKSRDGVNPL